MTPTGSGSRGSGVLRKASPGLRRAHAWVLGLTGGDRTGRFVDAGVFTLASGNISNGAIDVNDTGTYVTVLQIARYRRTNRVGA